MTAESSTQGGTRNILAEISAHRRREETSGNSIARSVLLATIDLVGPERGIYDLRAFVSTVGKVREQYAHIQLLAAMQMNRIQEVKPSQDENLLFYWPTRYQLNLEQEETVEQARAESIILGSGREITRQKLSEIVELRLDADTAQFRVEHEIGLIHDPNFPLRTS